MSYTVLARKYRSTSFDTLVGQDAVSRTLTNAITSGRVHHAYLFTGTRGVGKTSMARILARALNAPDTIPGGPKPDDGHRYPPVDVQQRMAEAIMRGEDLNVIEIDGASNNRVEEARQLIQNSGLAPTDNARYKVYIIDEVHMLSTAAFNALLKTLEEPPAHVKFILCTTESHKVPATIQSRCQRFDFRSISSSRIAGHLQAVLDQEKIAAEGAVVFAVAQIANGSMRDALSLLDRLIAASPPPLTLASLEELLGLPPRERVVRVVEAIANGDPAGVLEEAHALAETGIGLEQLLEVLIDRFRSLMLLSVCGPKTTLVELSDDDRKLAVEQASRFDAAGLVYLITLAESLTRNLKFSSQPRALLEACLVRMALAEKMVGVAEALDEKKKP